MENAGKASSHTGISARALLIGLLCVVLVCFIVSYAELIITYIQIGFLQLPPVVIGFLFFLVLLNHALKRLHPRLRLAPHELMIIYTMMLVASMISSRGLMEKLIPALIAVNYYANQPNAWAELFFPHIKPWLVPFDPQGSEQQRIAVDFYEQLDPNSPIPWGPWLKPLVIWGVLVLLIFFAFLCLATILRRQWVDNEKLSFPLVQFPLEFVHDDPQRGFFRNRLMWLGFAVPAIIFTLNGLHGLYPTVPHLELQQTLNRYFTERPLNAMFYTPAFLSFASIGFFYLLPVQLLFSLWFFFWLTRVQDIAAAIMGWRVTGMPLYPTRLYIGYQVAGAYIALILYFTVVSWSHIKRVLRRAFRGKNGDDQELMSYQWAVWGLVVSFVLSVIWCYYGGLSLWFAAFELFIYLGVVAIIMARSTAECGMLMTETSFRPIDLYMLFRSKASLGAPSLTFLGMFDAIFTRDQRGLLLTGFLDALKFADGVKLKRRSLLGVFVLAIVVALICAATIHLWLPYRYGGNYMYGYVYRANPIWAFQAHASAVEGYRTDFSWTGLTFFVVGLLFALFLALMRAFYWWWPFHPLGYALSASWTMIVFWFPVLIAWVVKYPLTRYGGIRSYQKLRPLFLGMIFGEFSMAVLWTIISWIAHVPAPFFPWP